HPLRPHRRRPGPGGGHRLSVLGRRRRPHRPRGPPAAGRRRPAPRRPRGLRRRLTFRTGYGRDVAELHDLTALEQGDLVRRREVSPLELTEHYLERADRLDSVGAFVT